MQSNQQKQKKKTSSDGPKKRNEKIFLCFTNCILCSKNGFVLFLFSFLLLCFAKVNYLLFVHCNVSSLFTLNSTNHHPTTNMMNTRNKPRNFFGVMLFHFFCFFFFEYIPTHDSLFIASHLLFDLSIFLFILFQLRFCMRIKLNLLASFFFYLLHTLFPFYG